MSHRTDNVATASAISRHHLALPDHGSLSGDWSLAQSHRVSDFRREYRNKHRASDRPRKCASAPSRQRGLASLDSICRD